MATSPPAPAPLTALEAAQALVSALGLQFGEVTIKVNDGGIAMLRRGDVLKESDLAALEVPAA